jgi:hypothetical protein
MSDKTHYRKAFNSPYLSSADIVSESTFTISHVVLEKDKTKGAKTQVYFNTAYFKEQEIRPGEKMKPMILNVTNSRTMAKITGSAFIEDWRDVRVVVYVDKNVEMMKKIVEGLRIREAPKRSKVLPGTANWENAKAAFKRDKNFDAVLKHADISEEHQAQIREECKNA